MSSFEELKPFEATDLAVTIRFKLIREGSLLHVEYALAGAIDRIRFADRALLPSRKDELWKTTCFELFFSPKGSKKYWEFNFSPPGDWNCYRFDDYRIGMQREERIGDLGVSFSEDRLRASLDLSKISELAGYLDFSATAVVETCEGQISYWALKHAGEKPDFHLRASMIRISD